MSIQQNQHVQHNTAHVQHDIKLMHRHVQHNTALVQHNKRMHQHAQHHSIRMHKHVQHKTAHVQHTTLQQLGPDTPACTAQHNQFQDPVVATPNPFSDQSFLNWNMFPIMLPDFANQMFLSDLLSPQHIAHITPTQATCIKRFILDLLEELIQDGQVVNDSICEQFKSKLLPSFEDPPPLSPHPIVKSNNVTNPKTSQSLPCDSMVGGQSCGNISLSSDEVPHFHKNAGGLGEGKSKIRKSKITEDYCCLNGDNDTSKGSSIRSFKIQTGDARTENSKNPHYPNSGLEDEDMEVEPSIPTWIHGDDLSDDERSHEGPSSERKTNRNGLEATKGEEKSHSNKKTSTTLEAGREKCQNKSDIGGDGNENCSFLKNGRRRSNDSQKLSKTELESRHIVLFASTTQYRATKRECTTKRIEYFEDSDDNSELDPDYEERKSKHRFVRWRIRKSKADEKSIRVQSLKLTEMKSSKVNEVGKESRDHTLEKETMPESGLNESKRKSKSTETKPAHTAKKKLTHTVRSRLAPATPEISVRVNILPNLNDTSCNPDVRSTYHPTCDIKDLECLYSITPNRAAQSKSTSQCTFCSLLYQTAEEIVEHLIQDHEDLLFALPKLKPPSAGDAFFLGCRHCNYLTFDPVLMWIHFQTGHGVSGILNCSEPFAELPPTDLEFLSMDNPVSTNLSYACCECGIVSTVRDPMVNHRLLFHQDVNFNGRMLDVLTIKTPDHLEGCTTYREIVQSEELVGCRQKIFVCAPCKDFTTACSYQALAHDILVHQSKVLIYVCSECSYQSLTEASMKMHLHERESTARGIIAPSPWCNSPRTPVNTRSVPYLIDEKLACCSQ